FNPSCRFVGSFATNHSLPTAFQTLSRVLYVCFNASAPDGACDMIQSHLGVSRYKVVIHPRKFESSNRLSLLVGFPPDLNRERKGQTLKQEAGLYHSAIGAPDITVITPRELTEVTEDTLSLVRERIVRDKRIFIAQRDTPQVREGKDTETKESYQLTPSDHIEGKPTKLLSPLAIIENHLSPHFAFKFFIKAKICNALAGQKSMRMRMAINSLSSNACC
ncbi:hypothetical protein PROFUN_14161, partial [Planoprotostelium fungivorum]